MFRFNKSNFRMLLLTIALIIAAIITAHAHSDGEMVYDPDCCHNKDCAPVIEMGRVLNGDFFVSKHGTVIVTEADKIKRRPSKDNRFHICMRDANEYELAQDKRPKRPICLYSPALY